MSYDDHQYHEHRHDEQSYELSKESIKGAYRSHRRLFRVALIVIGVVLALVVIAVIAMIVLIVHFVSVPATGILEAVTEAWQSFTEWFRPVTDMYNKAINLLPGA